MRQEEGGRRQEAGGRTSNNAKSEAIATVELGQNFQFPLLYV